MMTTITKALPGERISITTNTTTEPFWQAAKDKRLTVPQCSDCGTFRMPPRPYCPDCQSQAINWVQLPGTATIYSFAVCDRSPYPDVPDFTYLPIVVDLDGAPGTRLVSNLIDADPQTVEIGAKVTVDWHAINDGWLLPVFRLQDQ